MRHPHAPLLVLVALLALGCQERGEAIREGAGLEPEAGDPTRAPDRTPAEEPRMGADIRREEVRVQRASTELDFRQGLQGSAEVTFRALPDGRVQLIADIEGAEAGTYALHLHENGMCEPPTFASAGDHFNPTDEPHGLPTAPRHHAGDFGNIEVAADGTGHLELTSDRLEMEPASGRSPVGKAVVLHLGRDRGTGPAGGAGGRIACGVVRARAPDPEWKTGHREGAPAGER